MNESITEKQIRQAIETCLKQYEQDIPYSLEIEPDSLLIDLTIDGDHRNTYISLGNKTLDDIAKRINGDVDRLFKQHHEWKAKYRQVKRPQNRLDHGGK